MHFLVDEQLPPGLASWLISQGHKADHVNELGMGSSDDIDIWNHALSIEATIVTKDEDFAERTARTTSGPPIIWLRIGNSTNQALVEWLKPRWATITQLITDGNRLIEVR